MWVGRAGSLDEVLFGPDGCIGRLQPGTPPNTLRLKVQATFGLINSTPHSIRGQGRQLEAKTARPILEAMALAALLA